MFYNVSWNTVICINENRTANKIFPQISNSIKCPVIGCINKKNYLIMIFVSKAVIVIMNIMVNAMIIVNKDIYMTKTKIN